MSRGRNKIFVLFVPEAPEESKVICLSKMGRYLHARWISLSSSSSSSSQLFKKTIGSSFILRHVAADLLTFSIGVLMMYVTFVDRI